MVELNLLPDVKREFLKAQRTRNTVTSMAILVILAGLGIIVLMALFVFGAQNAQIYLYNQSIDERSKELESIAEIDKYVTVQNQLSQLHSLHEDKNTYSRFMKFFQTLNPEAPNEVSLTGVDMDSDEATVSLMGTTKSFESFNIFKDTLLNADVSYIPEDEDRITEKLFSNLTIESAVLSDDGDQQRVSFSVLLSYNEAAFAYNVSGTNLNVPSIETTGSAQSAPKPLFSEGDE